MPIDPDSQLSELLGVDLIKWQEMVQAFDVLTNLDAQPDVDIFRVSTVRHLYLYYLTVLSRPIDRDINDYR
jgi:hypothetical protein